MASPPNPFRPTRFEHHEHPLIWLSPNVKRLEGSKSVYVAGTRGSGKTSLLKAINWRERLRNVTVRDQLGDETTDYVAVYFRLPDYLTGAVGLVNWAKHFPDTSTPELVGCDFFCQLIEFVGAQLICEAMSSLRAAQRLSYSPHEEDLVVASILKSYPNLSSFQGSGPTEGLDGLSLVFKRLHQRLNILVTRGQIHEAVSLSLEVQPGVFINDFVGKIRDLAHSRDVMRPSEFHIKICIDDCETLQPLQQKFLNSLVRKTEAPLSWVVSYVSVNYNTSDSIYPNHTLTDADRSQLLLDDMKNSEFYRLCEAVSLLRIYYSSQQTENIPLKQLSPNFFSLELLLGKPSINRLLETLSENSLSSEFAKLIENSRRQKRRGRNGELPIFETYVQEKLGKRLIDERPDNLHAYLRRKNVAALLTICAEYRIANIPYVGAATIASLSNQCIRDYLELIGAIYDEAIGRNEISSIADFTKREYPLSLDTQRNGVRRSSRAKLDGIRNIIERDWAEATRVVEFMGKLTSMLQSTPDVEATLATPERGNFLFDLSKIDMLSDKAVLLRDWIARVLRRCEADGFLRPGASHGGQDGDGQELVFHLHRRFAPEFGFSYRGPYGLVRMPMPEFVAACTGSGEHLEPLVERAFSRIGRDLAVDHPRLL